jgi:hypothetical protein
MEKKCRICNQVKTLDLFSVRKRNSNGVIYRTECKQCNNKISKKTNLRLRNKLKENPAEIPLTKICKRCESTKSNTQFYKNAGRTDGLSVYCIECQKDYFKRPSRIDYDKRRTVKRRVQENYLEYQKLYREKNMKKFVEYNKMKYNSDPIFKLKHCVRGRIYKYIKRKSIPTNSILGCTWECFKKHIENQFEVGMNWDNHEQFGWHLDHIVPLSSAKNEQELLALNHYTNFQPLWWRDNLVKNDKL